MSPTSPSPVPLWGPLPLFPALYTPLLPASTVRTRRQVDEALPTSPPATPPVIHYHLFAFFHLPPSRQQHQLCALVDQFGYTRPQQDIDRLPGGMEGGREGRGGTEEEVRREEGPGREGGGSEGCVTVWAAPLTCSVGEAHTACSWLLMSPRHAPSPFQNTTMARGCWRQPAPLNILSFFFDVDCRGEFQFPNWELLKGVKAGSFSVLFTLVNSDDYVCVMFYAAVMPVL